MFTSLICFLLQSKSNQQNKISLGRKKPNKEALCLFDTTFFLFWITVPIQRGEKPYPHLQPQQLLQQSLAS